MAAIFTPASCPCSLLLSRRLAGNRLLGWPRAAGSATTAPARPVFRIHPLSSSSSQWQVAEAGCSAGLDLGLRGGRGLSTAPSAGTAAEMGSRVLGSQRGGRFACSHHPETSSLALPPSGAHLAAPHVPTHVLLAVLARSYPRPCRKRPGRTARAE